MQSEYVSVKEYAILRGCSTESVYKRIRRGTLDGYWILVDGQKMIRRELLDMEGVELLPEPKTQPVDEPTSEPTTNLQPRHEQSLADIVERLARLEDKVDNILEAMNAKPNDTNENQVAQLAEPKKQSPWWQFWK